MHFSKAFVLAFAAFAAAHPGHEDAEAAQALKSRQVYHANKRALEACGTKLSALHARGVERRTAEVAKHRIARRIAVNDPYLKENAVKRDTTSVLQKDHQGTINATLALESDASYVFNASSSTVLNPEGEIGPFFVNGEYVRSDLRNDEPGVDVVLEAQLIDVNTCEPIVGAYFDIWSCNSTGVYSGVQTNMNGNGADASNLNNTALRGIQLSDDDGVVQFTTKFPGHYAGRATHLHVVVHQDATQLENGTIVGSGTVPHIGQFFWDQKLITQVEATSPYTENTQRLTLNALDRVFGAQETRGTTSDPVFNYVFFGDTIEDGLFSWIYVGIDTSASYTPSYSFQLTDHGGEATGTGGGPGGPGGPPA
ncbi:hypothetical protein G7054_g2667 [Neopestalotiopsis clavispora]|nr:hypothetical protein E8E14_006334 [Neopestalotiopsis sp. 37M]KAF7538874.1 hypothetical protein G7054_g2667 [Neopestalotiopsis clavispora]